MRILFPSDPIQPSKPDEDFRLEFNAAELAGFKTELVHHESLTAGETSNALRFCRESGSVDEQILLRGWMLNDVQYAELDRELREKGYSPVTIPADYCEAHYLPNAYDRLEEFTAESKWAEGADPEVAWQLYQPFLASGAIIKDYVKSAKHRWKDACYIPPQTNRDRFNEIFHAFVTARGSLFNKGTVLRRFHRLAQRGSDIRGFPLVEEYRFFFWDGALFAHPDFEGSSNPRAHLSQWAEIAKRFKNRFISMDVALLEEGGWIVVEVGDGQVSGLPLAIDPVLFYAALWNHAAGTSN